MAYVSVQCTPCLIVTTRPNEFVLMRQGRDRQIYIQLASAYMLYIYTWKDQAAENDAMGLNVQQ